VQTRVAERDEAQRAAMLGEPVPSRETTRRSNRECEREEPERPEPGLDLELLDGICAEVVGEGTPRQPDGWDEADDDERKSRETPTDQKNFLRSIPA
jgi:hypothetical protein